MNKRKIHGKDAGRLQINQFKKKDTLGQDLYNKKEYAWNSELFD